MRTGIIYYNTANREEFQYTHHEQKAKASGDGSSNYSQLITTQHIHESESQTVPQKYVEKYANQKQLIFNESKD